jgi:hypothetical protein
MKKLVLALVIAAVIPAAALFAQESGEKKFKNESEFFYISVPIEKIFPYRKGYIVQYRKGVNRMAMSYLPEEWFWDLKGKGQLIALQAPTAWPYMAVYYNKDGEFSHIKLYIRKNRSHETWGLVPLNVNIDDRFENIEDVKIEF